MDDYLDQMVDEILEDHGQIREIELSQVETRNGRRRRDPVLYARAWVEQKLNKPYRQLIKKPMKEPKPPKRS